MAQHDLSFRRSPFVVLAAVALIAGTMLSVAGDDEPATLSPAQLDQLTAPIALYPDPLLGSILAAATYPLEVVEAARWLEDPANAALHGDPLAVALQSEPWDVSVKALVGFPYVLRMMNDNLQWTEQIGDAFLAQQGDVMDSIQRLRRDARTAGTLESTPQQTVGSEGQDVTIEPANPDIVYVPYYSPLNVYGPWPWAEFPPFYFGPPPGVFYAGPIGFGIGIGIVGPLWGWSRWNWPAHALIVPHYGHRAPEGPRWTHDPGHRAGVPYRNSAVAQRYLGPGTNFRPGFRGYASETPRAPQIQRRPPPPANTPLPRAPYPHGAPSRPHAPFPSHAPSPPRVPFPSHAPSPPRVPSPPAAAPRGPLVVPRAPPAFESYGRGPQVRADAARGFSSRSAPRAAPSVRPGGAVRGGGGRR